MSIDMMSTDTGIAPSDGIFDVEVRSFTKFYGEKMACDGIDFFARKNSITGIIGPNGAGKSTLLKAISGIHFPSSGAVSVCGFSDPCSIRSVCAFTGEFPVLEEKLTVKEILWNVAGKDYTEGVAFGNLKDVLFSKASLLSKGYRQRVVLAKEFLRRTKVLVLDEFTAGLDPAEAAGIRRSVRLLSKDCTVIFSTHRIEEAENLCDYIYIMDGGKIAVHGSKSSILQITEASGLEEAFMRVTGEK